MNVIFNDFCLDIYLGKMCPSSWRSVCWAILTRSPATGSSRRSLTPSHCPVGQLPTSSAGENLPHRTAHLDVLRSLSTGPRVLLPSRPLLLFTGKNLRRWSSLQAYFNLIKITITVLYVSDYITCVFYYMILSSSLSNPRGQKFTLQNTVRRVLLIHAYKKMLIKYTLIKNKNIKNRHTFLLIMLVEQNVQSTHCLWLRLHDYIT